MTKTDTGATVVSKAPSAGEGTLEIKDSRTGRT